MDDAEKVDLLLANCLAVFPAPQQLVLVEVMAKLKEIAYSSDSALWKRTSDQFIESAKEAKLETDAQFYLTVGSVCIGCCVTLARQERLTKTIEDC